MTIDGLLASFSAKLRSLATLVASFYVSCVFLSMSPEGSAGYLMVGKFLRIIGVDNFSMWINGVYERMVQEGFLCGFHIVLLAWLVVSLFFLVADYGSEYGNLFPQSAMAVSFFWCVLEDLFYEVPLIGFHTLLVFVFIAIIAFRSYDSGESFWIPSFMAACAIIFSPLYVLFVVPFWLASEDDRS
ncbi:hypothetical protein MHT86_02585 [Corynebacterium mastitidis]|uniref:hypothetical protein n=1 Tax=Corynebacterium mastitidis TaxID=161890 RepID=UPI0012FF1D69|nr:hypothetical protein [Corynebacterium mastitidis]MCH6196388.1 hypothetical protein [Corynebacterium mastitidis]